MRRLCIGVLHAPMREGSPEGWSRGGKGGRGGGGGGGEASFSRSTAQHRGLSHLDVVVRVKGVECVLEGQVDPVPRERLCLNRKDAGSEAQHIAQHSKAGPVPRQLKHQ